MSAVDVLRSRHAGLLLPLFSMPTRRSWGIGEIGDIPAMAAWLRDAGHDILQILPANEMAAGQTSPYSALSAMAIDPLYVSVGLVDDFVALGGERALDRSARRLLDRARAAGRVAYESVRAVKALALRAAFDRFVEAEWTRRTDRAARLRAYVADQAWWLDDYALFRAIRMRPDVGDAAWWTWPAALRRRHPGALARERARLAREVLFVQYLQWTADVQWQDARASARGVGLFGDFPFMVAADSADVWARQDEFDLDASIGTPPDVFSETGQDWQLPAYRWDVQRANDFEWLRLRARRYAALFDGYRIDHVIGFYRMFVRPPAGPPFFSPADETDQIALGERLIAVFRDAGAAVIAEDLGTVPDFLRASLARLEVPGYRVLRWERDWEVEGQPFHDPAAWPAISVATSGTHDTETMAGWWDEADEAERRALLEIPALRRLGPGAADRPCDPEIRDALLEMLYRSGSNLLILPVQDVFGWRDRINTPGTVSDDNWTYRLPWPVDDWRDQPEARDRARAIRRWAEGGGR